MSEHAPRILLIDNEPPILPVLKPLPAAGGFEVASAEDGAGAQHTVVLEAPDGIIIDLGLPDIGGNEVIASLRKWIEAPIILLARHDETERIAALCIGADDYATKPCGRITGASQGRASFPPTDTSRCVHIRTRRSSDRFALRRVAVGGQERYRLIAEEGGV